MLLKVLQLRGEGGSGGSDSELAKCCGATVSMETIISNVELISPSQHDVTLGAFLEHMTSTGHSLIHPIAQRGGNKASRVGKYWLLLLLPA